MLGKNNSYKVLKIFLDSPIENFRLREIARLSGISPPSVMNYLAEFIKERLIDKNIKNKIPIYTAIRDNLNFILYKKLSIIFELNNSGLVEYLWEKLSPETINNILNGIILKGYIKAF